MSPKPAFAITLPRNFALHYNDNQLPHTPAPQDEEELHVMEPPPPPRQTFKVRRRKADSVPRDIIADIEGDGLPIIEMTEVDGNSSPESGLMDLLPGYLAPKSTRLPLLSPPKTPVSQITDHPHAGLHACDWTTARRPLSSCSNFSNSSVSSRGSSVDSLRDFGGDCTSPESDVDPFTYESKPALPIFSPDLSSTSPVNKRAKTYKDAKWTPEMDNHLWLTYLKCLQDPELTPFKMLPGTAPPLGICGRVARDAKHSWKGPRQFALDVSDNDTIRPSQAKTWSHWPRNDAGTRRRLRKLCKRSPSLSAHYQRLMQARTPSPFQSSSSPPDVRSDAQPSSYRGIRDEGSLASSFAAPLTSDAPFGLLPHKPAPRARADGWFERVGRRSQAHQKSQSLQIALGRYGAPNDLASPFNVAQDEATGGTNFTRSLGRSLHPTSMTPALKSPLELHAPVPTNRSLKRRFGILDESPDNISRLEGLFNAPTQQSYTRPTRDRAFSVGTALDNSRVLSFGTERMGGIEAQMNDDIFAAPAPSLSSQNNTRLGSPFTLPPPKPHFNTFPRQFTPLGTEMPQHNFRANFSLEGRFRELAAQQCARQ